MYNPLRDALRDALMIEVKNLFAQNKVFKQNGAPRSRFETVLIIRYRRDPDWLRARHCQQCFSYFQFSMRCRTATVALQVLVVGVLDKCDSPGVS